MHLKQAKIRIFQILTQEAFISRLFRRFRRTVAAEPIENISRNTFYIRIFSAEAVCPVGGTAGEDGAAAGVNAEDGSAYPALLETVVPVGIVRVPFGGSGGEDYEIGGGAVAAGGIWQTIAQGDFAAIAFVADDGVFAAEVVVLF